MAGQFAISDALNTRLWLFGLIPLHDVCQLLQHAEFTICIRNVNACQASALQEELVIP